MSSASDSAGPGGFLQPTLPSPTATSQSPPAGKEILPQPRSTPLKPGSAKESSFINYVDKKLLNISRRYEKRFNTTFEDDSASGIEGRGYESYAELASDLEGLIDVVWVSSTPSLQTPYLLTIALTACTCLAPFPFSPRPTFQLLHKLDVAFNSLLDSANTGTGMMLPGHGRGKLSTTEKVRMRGLVERTRLAVVEVAGKGGSVDGIDSVVQSPVDTEDEVSISEETDDMKAMQVDGNHGRWEMEIARVYEKTIVELGVSLDTAGIN